MKKFLRTIARKSVERGYNTPSYCSRPFASTAVQVAKVVVSDSLAEGATGFLDLGPKRTKDDIRTQGTIGRDSFGRKPLELARMFQGWLLGAVQTDAPAAGVA